jgi:putative flavoprotein involved in K+ transport
MDKVETVVIGGGQAGLAMSYHLGQRGLEHLVIERARVAQRWRSQRWDSLMFQFPNWSVELPGRPYARGDPNAFSHKDQILGFLEDYATWIKAPLRTGVNVLRLREAAQAGRYLLSTDYGDVDAHNVVVATGPYQRPKVPAGSAAFPANLLQLHAGDYRNPSALPAGAVLVVGSGASGCQIAEELSESGRHVYFSVGRHRRLPRRYRGRDVFWWRRALGHLDQTVGAPYAQRMPAPLVTGVRGGHDIDIRAYAAKGMTHVGKVLDVRDARVTLASDLDDNLKNGDQSFQEFTHAVDENVESFRIDAPREPGKASLDLTKVTPETLSTIDLRAAGIRSIVWATGYSLDFGWIQLPVFDEQSQPIHRRGVTSSTGIYFLGLPWLHKAKSSFLYGVGEDAEYLANQIAHERSSKLTARPLPPV